MSLLSSHNVTPLEDSEITTELRRQLVQLGEMEEIISSLYPGNELTVPSTDDINLGRGTRSLLRAARESMDINNDEQVAAYFRMERLSQMFAVRQLIHERRGVLADLDRAESE